MRSVPESGSDRVTVLAISILAIGRDPVATALGTDCITVVLQIRAPAELGGFWSSSSINISPLRGFGNEHFMAALAKQPNSGHRRTSDNVDAEASRSTSTNVSSRAFDDRLSVTVIALLIFDLFYAALPPDVR